MKRKGKGIMHANKCCLEKSTQDNTTVMYEFHAVDKNLVTKTNKECNTERECKEQSISQMAEIAVKAENKQDEVNKMDETYELKEPETPKLRKMVQEERRVNKKSLTVKPMKRRLRVQFKDSVLSKSLPDITAQTSSEKNLSTPSTNILRKRKNPIRNEITSTVDPKILATKKVPNFAEIHKKMFNKLESVVDAKKRLRDRHTTLTTIQTNKSTDFKINSNQLNRLPDKPNKSPFNRFGFKIKKQEATECILRNSSLQTRSKVQQQNRTILKGVRTNRRFELQMKARNLVI